MNKILIADDNQQITSILANYARKEGFEPLVALDGQQALELFEQHEKNIDVVLLDVMMPKLDGFEVCRELRRRSMVPIIMVTARGEDFERIMGLDIGADDYILKPFSAGEVMARVRAILRRVQPREAEQQNLYSVGNLVIDLDKYLDDAYLAHLEKVRVVHGRGTGALRNGVHQHLRKLKYVKSFHLGEFGEGDSGCLLYTSPSPRD